MTINYDNIHQAIAALNQCAKENENRQTDTGVVRVSDLCTDVAHFLCKVRQDHKQWQETKDGRYASARVFMAETNDKFRQACIQRKQQSGDDMTGYMPPSHQMEVSFTQEFRQRALEAARKRLVSEHPEWTGADLEDPERNQDLRNAMYDAVRCRLGSMYCHQRPSQSAAPSVANVSQAQGAQSWQDGQPFPAQEETDDLPF